jgi:hypothetical protein
MLSDIGRGSLGPGHANVLALNMLEDGLRLPAVRDLGSLGNWGKYPANVERDLHRWVVLRITLCVLNQITRVTWYLIPEDITIVMSSGIRYHVTPVV